MYALELQNVTKRIKEQEIISNLSFELKYGEILGFLGPNGAGKTTTIRMITGLMKVTDGDIIVAGKSIQKEWRPSISQIGAIIETPSLYPYMTGRQNLRYFSRMYTEVDENRINDVVIRLEIDKVLDQKVKNYSLGMKQRLGIAVALLHQPQILILDEPTNGLDPAGIKEIRNYLKYLAHQENIAILVSSHLLAEVELMCDRVIIIQNGKRVFIQDLKENRMKQQQKVKIKGDPIQVTNALHLYDPQLKISQADDGVLITRAVDEIPEIIYHLAQERIRIYEVYVVSKSLEEKFLEVVGDKDDGR
ncbi:ABC transporter ATP-binding protein [Thermoflavimicrobium daqui]|jgi:ABC-2 type transport system ATP-binding protein|uniref:Bacitracin ABC transporter ATP-binding protein n=1 Tax=Thermoflavimicrobium daqui TaxID=2137476 RepID=A0A364K9B7_9BACL|nr:ABC transporter ATP-binding protein [Thermoflavimicrobium daqui]RAL26896.1 bacitracin ABC transporter ATP-binding protein [Thermoflavimicrobium daqui]